MTVRYSSDGTPTTCISLTADVTDGNFAGGTTEFNNSGASDKWNRFRATLSLPDGCTGGAWDTTPTVGLYGVKKDIDSTNDELAPSGTDDKGAHYLGSFILDDHATAATAQYRQIVFSLLDTDKFDIYIKNETGRSLDYVATAITVKIEGISDEDV